MKAKNWDTETADTCRLPEFIPDVCERCRCYAYCHRQRTIEEMLEEVVELKDGLFISRTI